MEGKKANAGHTVWDGDARQAGAAYEGFHANAGHSQAIIGARYHNICICAGADTGNIASTITIGSKLQSFTGCLNRRSYNASIFVVILMVTT